jgi:DNA end-binding protein Ku
MGSTIQTVTVQMGALTIPMKISAGPRGKSESFNLFHHCQVADAKTKTEDVYSRIKMPKHCPVCDVDVETADLLKGFEATNQNGETQAYMVTPEEIKSCAPDSSEIVEIEYTVPSEQIDPSLFESTYYLAPDLGKNKKNVAAERAYALLLASLKNTYAIARVAMHQREHLIVIRPINGVLGFHTAYFEDEYREAPDVNLPTLTKGELEVGAKLVKAFTQDFDHSKYSDTFRANVEALKETKIAGKTVKTRVPKKPMQTEGDLMKILEMSINMKTASGPATKKRKVA